MPKLYKPPFTLEEDLARLQGLLPPPAMVEQFGDLLHRAHKSNVGPHERSHWLGCVMTTLWALRQQIY